jgi:hypothetical protein
LHIVTSYGAGNKECVCFPGRVIETACTIGVDLCYDRCDVKRIRCRVVQAPGGCRLPARSHHIADTPQKYPERSGLSCGPTMPRPTPPVFIAFHLSSRRPEASPTAAPVAREPAPRRPASDDRRIAMSTTVTSPPPCRWRSFGQQHQPGNSNQKEVPP